MRELNYIGDACGACVYPSIPRYSSGSEKQQEKQKEALVYGLSLVLISLRVKLLQCNCWRLKIYAALPGKGLHVSFEL